MKCEEYVGPATGTGSRRRCSRRAVVIVRYRGVGDEVALCKRHRADYETPDWVVVDLIRYSPKGVGR